MKKIIPGTIAALFVTSLLLMVNNSAWADDTIKDNIRSDWSVYSYGLHYKALAITSKNPVDRKKNLEKAIEYFLVAESFGKSLDLVYFELAECHYYNYSIKRSLEYAKKSIKINNKSQAPYRLMFRIYVKLRNHQKAADILEEYSRVVPNSILVQYVLGEHYYQNLRDMKKAESTFKNVIKMTRVKPLGNYYMERVYYYLGYISYKKNRINDAIDYFVKSHYMNRNSFNSVYMLAVLHMGRYELDDAEKYANKYLKKYPGNTTINFILGRIKYIRNSPDAMQYLRSARKAKSIDSVLAMGLYYELIQDDAKAERLLKTVAKYRPQFISPRLALARVQLRKGNKKGAFDELIFVGGLAHKYKLYYYARNYFTLAASLNPDVVEVYYYLGKINEELGHYYLAILNYKKVQKLKPSVDMLLHIGYLNAVKKDYKRAFRYFDIAHKMEPKNSRPYFFRGLVSIWDKNYPSAEKNIQKAITLKDKVETYYFYLAVVQEKRDKFDDTVESLKKAIEYNPQSARAHNYLGYLYAERGIHIEQSLSLVRRALEIDPENGAYLDSLGWVYFQQKKFKLALEKLLKAERLLDKSKSSDAVVYDHIGDTYREMNQSQKALEYWEKSIKIEKSQKIQDKIKEYQK
ncbi:MAG: tetratricopeptide repeat protein [bacterium]|nr:tetratricopeptide repeat protein [bacterium]